MEVKKHHKQENVKEYNEYDFSPQITKGWMGELSSII